MSKVTMRASREAFQDIENDHQISAIVRPDGKQALAWCGHRWNLHGWCDDGARETRQPHCNVCEEQYEMVEVTREQAHWRTAEKAYYQATNEHANSWSGFRPDNKRYQRWAAKQKEWLDSIGGVSA